MIHSLLASLPTVTDENETEGLDSQSNDEMTQSSPRSSSPSVTPSDIEHSIVVSPDPIDDESRTIDGEESESAQEDTSNDAASTIFSETTTLHEADEQDLLSEATLEDNVVFVRPSQPGVVPEELPSSSEPARQTTTGVLPKRRPSYVLASLLAKADSLYEDYPPNHPGLGLASIMGPQSVIFTWSQEPSSLPDDTAAERMVEHPELVVYPYIDEVPIKDVDTTVNQRGRHSKKSRRLAIDVRDRKAMVFGAVLVLGVAIALYGVRNGALRDRHNREHVMKNLETFGGWIFGAVIGVGGRVHQIANEF
jgi:TBC1 domain family member 20